MIRERHNPNITVLGSCSPSSAPATSVIRKAAQRLAGLLGDTGVKVYGPVTIRESVVAGIEGTRNMGRLAHEYEQIAARRTVVATSPSR